MKIRLFSTIDWPLEFCRAPRKVLKEKKPLEKYRVNSVSHFEDRQDSWIAK